MDEFIGFIKRQYNNFKIFKAYSAASLLRELVLFPRDLLSNSGESSNVLNIALFVTMRCNAGCAMCNISDILNKKDIADIPLKKIETLLDEVAPYRPSMILFGGEPFVRNDMANMVRAIKVRGLTVGTFTNGMLLNRTLIDGLIKEGLDYIAFSLQGTRQVHDRILSVRGAYDKMVENIRAFVKSRPRRTKVIIHTTICEHNIADLKNIAKVGLDLGVDLVRFGHPTFYSTEEARQYSDSLRDTFKEDGSIKAMSYIYDIRGKEYAYYKYIKDLKNEYGGVVSFAPALGDGELKSWYSADFASKRRCLFTLRGLFIYPNGDVYPCESISYKMGNVFEDGFRQVWNGQRYKAFRRVLKRGLLPACARCCKL